MDPSLTARLDALERQAREARVQSFVALDLVCAILAAAPNLHAAAVQATEAADALSLNLPLDDGVLERSKALRRAVLGMPTAG